MHVTPAHLWSSGLSPGPCLGCVTLTRPPDELSRRECWRSPRRVRAPCPSRVQSRALGARSAAPGSPPETGRTLEPSFSYQPPF